MREYQIRDFLQVFQIIGWIGKNDMIFFPANRNKPENIHSYRVNSFNSEFFRNFSDELYRLKIIFNQIDLCASAGSKLKAYTSCATEQFQYPDILKNKMVGQDIEQGLLGKIGCGSCIENPANRYFSASVCSADNSQVCRFSRFRNLSVFSRYIPEDREGIPLTFAYPVSGIYCFNISK